LNRAFQTTALVRFAHIDAAGIVFYPRYLEMLNGAVEDWCDQALGADFYTLHVVRKIGLPTVKLQVDFKADDIDQTCQPGAQQLRTRYRVHLRG
jgi:4-hydroxybenzoyl-CoA thioesterase